MTQVNGLSLKLHAHFCLHVASTCEKLRVQLSRETRIMLPSDKMFTAEQTADIARIKPATLKSWLARYEIKDGPEGGGRQGRVRLFNFYNVVHFCIAGQLIAEGVPTERALDAGATFAHTGMGTDSFQRYPGVPITDKNSTVETILCVSSKGTCAVPESQTRNWWHEANILLGNPDGMFCISINRLWFDACWKMGFPPAHVIETLMAEGLGE